MEIKDRSLASLKAHCSHSAIVAVKVHDTDRNEVVG